VGIFIIKDWGLGNKILSENPYSISFTDHIRLLAEPQGQTICCDKRKGQIDD